MKIEKFYAGSMKIGDFQRKDYILNSEVWPSNDQDEIHPFVKISWHL